MPCGWGSRDQPGRPDERLAPGSPVPAAVGLDELLAETLEDYVRIATALAGDLSRLADLRSGLRERMSRSPLMDAQRLARDLEAAYVGIWKNRPAARDPING